MIPANTVLTYVADSNSDPPYHNNRPAQIPALEPLAYPIPHRSIFSPACASDNEAGIRLQISTGII